MLLESYFLLKPTIIWEMFSAIISPTPKIKTIYLQYYGTEGAQKKKIDAYENTWKCGELKLYFSPSAGG